MADIRPYAWLSQPCVWACSPTPAQDAHQEVDQDADGDADGAS